MNLRRASVLRVWPRRGWLRDSFRFPDDKYWLYRIENNDRKEYVDKTYTLEHIMPQKLTGEWKTSLGPDHEHIHDEYLSSLGNLTLTGYNLEYSNHPFAHKRDTEGGFRQSPLKLNRNLGSIKA